MNNTIEYLGYKIIEEENSWKLVTSDDRILRESLSSLEDAQIEACKEEINKLSNKDGNMEPSTETPAPMSSDEQENNVSMTPEVEVEAEVVTEEHSTKEPMLEYINAGHASIISRFMQGDIPLFTYDGEIKDSYTHLADLDSGDSKYYYDADSDSIVVYNN